ncbi:hypothetical protein [Micromonospora mirobrigensis]|uniref:Uncharacterized protein n=1 Tax=Micromonospora mirobrigensis TaxID=262898 RepID=A0A1C4UX02_9ACTN|nr:hypothetical protein [Micromonospora mirobrigensis]SCE76218.1 hypothetical protein GA0070564_101779 [Micromonospora mirobrigensis]
MAGSQVFWLDDEYDREHAPDGHSRYAAEVRRRSAEFADSWGDFSPVGFAVTAWRLAAGLAPPYLRWHRRITSADLLRSPWDGTLTCRVSVASPRPAELTHSRQWYRDRGWRDWPRLLGQYAHPSAQDLARVPHLRASLLVEGPVPFAGLPPAPRGPDDAPEVAARGALAVLVRELNDLLGPVIGQLDAGVPAGS